MKSEFEPMTDDEKWWENSWKEREYLLRKTFGETYPPQSVFSFSWKSPFVMVPGGCGLVFPPATPSRISWLYLSLGLTQPLYKQEIHRANVRSEYGWEFGILTTEYSQWPLKVLFEIMTYLKESKNRIEIGHRIPLLFYKNKDDFQPHLRNLENADEHQPFGKMRAMVFWPFLPYLDKFQTSTGYFGILIGTVITEEEWSMAKNFSSTHLLLLLFRAGIKQVSDISRSAVTANPIWANEWERIKQYSQDEAEIELNKMSTR